MKTVSVVSAAASLLVVGCGGGSSPTSTASSGSTPPATTTSTAPTTTPAAPSPPATTPAPSSLLTSSVGTVLSGYGSVRNFARDGSGVTSVGFSYSAAYAPQATIAGPGAFSYQVRPEFFGGTNPPEGTFPLKRDASSDSIWTISSATANGRVLRVAQLNVGPANPLINLQYSTLAVAKITYPNTSPGMDSYSVAPLVFGLPFNTKSVTLRGTAVYDGPVAGIASAGQLEGAAYPLGTKIIYDLSGTFHVEMNFDASTFTGQIHLIGRNDVSGQTVDLGTFAINGTIPDPNTSSSIVGSTLGGSLQAVLAGPAAEELEVSFDAQVADPSTPSYYLKVLAVAAAKK